MRIRRCGLHFLTLATLAVGVSGCGVTRLSRSEEIQIGQQVSREIESQYRTYENPTVSRLGQRLAAVSERPDLPYRFRVINRPEINAVSLPGGPVYVFEGLLHATGDDDQMLAGVIAHEIGHIAKRHAAQQIERSQWYGIGIEVLTGGGSARDIATIAANLQLLHYSRKQEYEADTEAVRYTRAAGLNPSGLVRFFDLLLQRQKRGDTTIAWLRTHPTTEARRNRVAQLIQEQSARETTSATAVR
ncbi:MAG: M48 family metalloprotease [Armatimonadetes bacterium]|nr:M48 family metalloprotease [Armatimonadota bacterium]